MGDRPHVTLEKSRTVRRRYQRRKQQVTFSKAELERLERAEERDRRAKKLQEQEKRRIANKKKRLEKEAIAREERKKSGFPDPNAMVSSSQKLLVNFFGKKSSGGGGEMERNVRQKSESLVEDEGDTEVDSAGECETDKSHTPAEGRECSEVHDTESDDCFDDDDALTLFNDENVLKGINSSGSVKDCLEPRAGKKTGSTTASQTACSEAVSSYDDRSKLQPQPQPHHSRCNASTNNEKQVPNQLTQRTTQRGNESHTSQTRSTGVQPFSQTTTEIAEDDLFEDAIIEEIFHAGAGDIPAKSRAPGPKTDLQEPTADLYQDADDVLAGLCTQDFEDDDEENNDKTSALNSNPTEKQQRHISSTKQPTLSTRPPLRDLGHTSSLNLPKPDTTVTSPKQKDTPQTTTTKPQTTTAATSTIDDEYGSFSLTDEDLLYLGV
ncbi:hypothetical protein FQN54_000270 [Arachnomyces sp. PD_36]|nr:hypothetical protein FQN54_000270 [Arachnomyces sp. PD_36]